VISSERSKANRLTTWLAHHSVEPADVEQARNAMDRLIAAAPVMPTQNELAALAEDHSPTGTQRLRDAAVDVLTHPTRAKAHTDAVEALARCVIGAVHRHADTIVAGLQDEFNDVVAEMRKAAALDDGRTVESLVRDGHLDAAQSLAALPSTLARYRDLVSWVQRHCWDGRLPAHPVHEFVQGNPTGLDTIAGIRAGLDPWLPTWSAVRAASDQMVGAQRSALSPM
jgi:hypothetical protein